MLTDKTETLFAIARGSDVIGDAYTDVESAKQQLAFVEETMTSLGLKPDVDLVTIEVVTTVAKPKKYVEPEPATAEPESADGSDSDNTPPTAAVTKEKTAAKS